MDKILQGISDYYIRKGHISKEDREVYEYGFHLLLSDFINFSLIFILGSLLNQFINSVTFLLTFCIIRRSSGGFHAKKYWICRLSMMITFFSVILASTVCMKHREIQAVCIILNVLNTIFICSFAPIEHINKPLDSRQRKTNKKKAIILSLLFSTASTILIIMDMHIGIIISNTLSAVVVLMVIALKTKKKGGKSYV